MAEEIIRTTCSFCSIGCNVDVLVVDGIPTKLLPAKDYPVNLGKTCTKGFNMIKALESTDRALYPQIRDRATGETKRISWDQAALTFSQKFKSIQEKYGPESVAFLSTGQMTIEELALLGSVAKFGMGFKHGDGNTRQCMASAVVAYKQAFGFDAPPFTYRDMEESDCLIFIGANPSIAHPILWQRGRANSHKHTVVMVDPRSTESTKEADIHLAIQPKTDLQFLYSVANILIEKGWIDQEYIKNHTEGFEDFKAHVAQFPLEQTIKATGLSREQIESLAELIHTKEKVSIWWTMGVNQSHQGVRTAQAIINICLMTGNIGRVGTGPNSITGQCNAMGSRIFSNTSSLLGGRDFTKPEHRAEIAQILNIPEDLIPHDTGKSYDQILDAVGDGTIKALWIICTNPAHSWIDQNTFQKRLKGLEFLVVQDIYDTTETMLLGDLMLPAAAAGEKSGTLINSERRLGVVQKVKNPPGEAKSDFEIFQLLAKAWGVGDLFAQWKDPEAAFEILKTASRGQPCDITGIENWKALIPAGGIQWPWSEADAKSKSPVTGIPEGEDQQRRLFENGIFPTKSQKAKFLFTDVVPLPELPDDVYPFYLLTGRGTMHQWHTQTRTGKVEILKRMYPADSYAEIHPEDAAKMGIEPGADLRITSRRGSVVVKAMIKESVKPGVVFLPMHYPESNYLTYPLFDPYSRQPGYKFGAVRVEVV